MMNCFVGKLTLTSLICTSLIATSIVKPTNASPKTLSKETTCNSNNGHGNNKTTELQLVDLYLDDGTAYVLDYVVGTIDPSNPSHSALNLIDIYVDGTQVSYKDLATFQVIELLNKIKAVEDVELTGNNSTSEGCNDDEGEPDLLENELSEPEEEPLEVITYAD